MKPAVLAIDLENLTKISFKWLITCILSLYSRWWKNEWVKVQIKKLSMIWLLRHGNELFILFLAPVIGLILDIGLSRKNILYVLYVSLFLLLPLLFGYQYTLLFISQLLGLATLGCLFSFLLAQVAKQSHKYVVAILLSVYYLQCLALWLLWILCQAA